MNSFAEPSVEVIRFTKSDIITSSGPAPQPHNINSQINGTDVPTTYLNVSEILGNPPQ